MLVIEARRVPSTVDVTPGTGARASLAQHVPRTRQGRRQIWVSVAECLRSRSCMRKQEIDHRTGVTYRVMTTGSPNTSRLVRTMRQFFRRTTRHPARSMRTAIGRARSSAHGKNNICPWLAMMLLQELNSPPPDRPLSTMRGPKIRRAQLFHGRHHQSRSDIKPGRLLVHEYRALSYRQAAGLVGIMRGGEVSSLFHPPGQSFSPRTRT